MLQHLRDLLSDLHQELPKNDLVKWTGGNISVRDPESGLVVIKPSGVRYEVLKPEHMVIVDLEGAIIEGDLKPSSDTASHLYIYQRRPDVNGIVHTHSPYATAFAAIGRPIPVYLTAMADEFGGPIPCGGFALIGSEAIGRVVLEAIGDSPAVLLKNHGITVVAETVELATVWAASLERSCRAQLVASQFGTLSPIAPDEVLRMSDRFEHGYAGRNEALWNYMVRRAQCMGVA